MKLPRFHLRDVFWLVLVVAMGLGWWLSDRNSKTLLDVERKKVEHLAELRVADELRHVRERVAFSNWPAIVIPRRP